MLREKLRRTKSYNHISLRELRGIRWRWPDAKTSPVGFTSQPVFWRGRVILCSSAGLTNLDAETGEPVWHQKDGGGLLCDDHETLLFVRRNDSIRALDMESGDERARIQIDEPAPAGGMAVLRGRVLFGHKARFISYDWQRGCEAWRYEAPREAYLDCSPSVSDDAVCFGISRNLRMDKNEEARTVCLDLASGTERWRHHGSFAGDTFAPLIHGNHVYLGIMRRIVRLDLRDGMETMAIQAPTGRSPKSIQNCSFAIQGDRIYLSHGDNCLYSLDATVGEGLFCDDSYTPGWKGKVLWQCRISRRATWILSEPMVVGDTVLCHDGVCLYAVDRETGKNLWKWNSPEGITGVPACSDCALYVPCHDGLYALY